jgi:hypothetical protein
VKDLEADGVPVIQVDEPALREGLPLRRADWPAYLYWAAKAFRLATSGVGEETQIHTHMCTASLRIFFPRLRLWMPTLSRWNRHALAWSCSKPSALISIPMKSGQAYTTFTLHACPRPKRCESCSH